MFIALVIAVAIVGLPVLFVYYNRVVVPNRPEFSAHGTTLRIDQASKALVVTTPASLRVHSIPLGTLEVDVIAEMRKKEWAHLPDEPSGNTHINLYALDVTRHFVGKWQGHKGASPARMQVTGATLRNPDAETLLRWLRAHREVFPNEERLRREWDEACKVLERYCREQRSHKGSPALELIRFYAGPSIAYASIEKDGSIFAAAGTEPVLTASVRPPESLADEFYVYTPSDGALKFNLTAREMKALHGLQRSTGLTIAPLAQPLYS